mmetsp:Transcript_452/g.557  ORF Transcript_452/g.557 Transcript_452/m.557 type:complete len:87 (-) Transcript_452:741-1001(-)
MKVTVEYIGDDNSLPPATIDVQPSSTVEELLTLYSANHNQLDLTKVTAYFEMVRLKSELDLLTAGVKDEGRIVVKDKTNTCCCALF